MLERGAPREPHLYIDSIGISPSAQGQGLGKQLMQHLLSTADSMHVPIFLENSRERNLSFYAKYGFTITEKLTPFRDGPTLWLMIREPGK
ncbi:MAG: GNAT family N-acetyltransferase [Myxococcota bacterium]